MINQLNEIDSSEALDVLEQHLLAQTYKMDIPCKTNEMLNQLKENNKLLTITLIVKLFVECVEKLLMFCVSVSFVCEIVRLYFYTENKMCNHTLICSRFS